MAERTSKGEGEARNVKTNGTPNKSSSEKSATITTTTTRSSWTSIATAVLFLVLGIITPYLKESVIMPLAERSLGAINTAVFWSPSSRPTTEERSLLLQEQQAPTDTLKASCVPCDESNLSRFLHKHKVPGLHVLCLEDDGMTLTAQIFPHATMPETPTHYELHRSMAWQSLQRFCNQMFHLTKKRETQQPWAIFSSDGNRLMDETSTEETPGDLAKVLVRHGIVLLFEGGQFQWPGVRIGFKRQVQLLPENRTVTLQTLSLVPLVLSVQGFLSEAECDHVQTKAQPTMKYSEVVLMDQDKGRPASDFRTSQTTFLTANDDDTLLDIDHRTASLVRVPRRHQEPVQVLRYGIGEKYNSHADYFDPKLYTKDPNTLRLIQDGRRNRMATVFWYLSDVEAGGETIFPRFNGGRELSTTDCETGLKVKPEKGKVIIFYSMTADGNIDENSLHGACPVKEGIKWAGNKWVWNEPMLYVR